MSWILETRIDSWIDLKHGSLYYFCMISLPSAWLVFLLHSQLLKHWILLMKWGQHIVACLWLACHMRGHMSCKLATCTSQPLSTPAAQLTSFITDLSALSEMSTNCCMWSYAENFMTRIKMSKVCFKSIQSAIILSQDQRMAHCISMYDYQVLSRL